ncbi:small VCP/p97-interacting protein [Geospiza fortis]|uniref:Small VCP/p97-interacting protein n=1 Tax=Geospiza fortis TaxID=48883 RepID=A0A8N5I2L6_GEOFO|nr:small VCP/p97-interacting protein [Geospiza fortis]
MHQCNPKHKYKLDKRWIESPQEKARGVRSSTGPSNVHLQPAKPTTSRAALCRVRGAGPWPPGRAAESSGAGGTPQLGPGPRNLRVLCPAPRAPCAGPVVLCAPAVPVRREVKRRQLAEAAEKRQMEASSRGIKNVYSVEQKKKKQEEIERRMAASRPGEEGGLRWQVG